mgnify:FL=1
MQIWCNPARHTLRRAGRRLNENGIKVFNDLKDLNVGKPVEKMIAEDYIS